MLMSPQQFFMYRIHHNPETTDLSRCTSYKRSREVLAGVAEFCDSPQIFPKDEADLIKIIHEVKGETRSAKSHLSPDCPSDVTLELILEARCRYLSAWESLPNAVKPHHAIIIRPSWFGLALNNILAIEHFLSSSLEYLLMLQDDVYLSNGFPQEVFAVIASMPSDWDAFNFIVDDSFKKRFRDFLRISPESIYSRSYQDWPFACVLLSRQGAKKLLSSFLFPTPSHIPLNFARGDDTIIHNVSFFEMQENYTRWDSNFSPNRLFQTFTFIPVYPKVVNWSYGEIKTTLI